MGGLDGEEGEEGVGNVLDGMMRQLMTREILMEPLEELADKVGRLGVVVPDVRLIQVGMMTRMCLVVPSLPRSATNKPNSPRRATRFQH